jgi:hypothetical protein
MNQFILYTTSHCHLCEHAEALLLELGEPLDWIAIEIATDDVLMQKYGRNIPVIKNCNKDLELNWPFSKQDIIKFISSNLIKE